MAFHVVCPQDLGFLMVRSETVRVPTTGGLGFIGVRAEFLFAAYESIRKLSARIRLSL